MPMECLGEAERLGTQLRYDIAVKISCTRPVYIAQHVSRYNRLEGVSLLCGLESKRVSLDIKKV